MTYRKATPEETKAFYGKPFILFGVRPPASWGAKSPSTAVNAPEAVSQFLPWRPMPPDPTDEMERMVNARFGPPSTGLKQPERHSTETDKEMAKALGF